MIINRSKYHEADPNKYLRFTHASQKNIEPALAGRLAYLCYVEDEMLNISRGLVTSVEQKAAGDALLAEHSDYYRDENGAVRRKNDDVMMASAPGDSNHEARQAIDSGDSWLKALTNAYLESFGLYKPLPHEPWHVQCIETRGVSKTELKKYFLNGGNEMDDISKVQTAMKAIGFYTLAIDGKDGPGTKSGAEKLLPIVLHVLNLQDPRTLKAEHDDYKKRLDSIKAQATV